MKKFKMLFSLFVVSLLIAGFFLPTKFNPKVFSDTNPSVNVDVITNELSEVLKTWIVKNDSQYYKDITVECHPISVVIKDGKAEVVFHGAISEMLKAKTAHELPEIRGMQKFLKLKQANLSHGKLSAVNDEINYWVKTVNENYIGKIEAGNFGFKVVADLTDEGHIQKETAKLFLEDAEGGFEEITNGLYLSPDEMEQDGFEHAKKIADNAKDIGIEGFYIDTYNGTAAAQYAEAHSSNSSGLYDSSYWNNTEFPFALTMMNSPYGSDCADFVSQAMYKGGIPMDPDYLHDRSHWWCNMYSSTPPPDYAPWIWIKPASQNNYTGLKNYMLQIRGYWERTDIHHVRVGGIMVSQSNDHVMMVTGNDSVKMYLTAHTQDRKHYVFYDIKTDTFITTNPPDYYKNCEYYNVHKYTWVN